MWQIFDRDFPQRDFRIRNINVIRQLESRDEGIFEIVLLDIRALVVGAFDIEERTVNGLQIVGRVIGALAEACVVGLASHTATVESDVSTIDVLANG